MYTDENIPMECPECDYQAEGKPDMLSHVQDDHGYTAKEAERYVSEWIDNAYIAAQEELAEYYQERKLDRAIHADAFPNK
jgi:NADH:ubiquinone oxidoreductase subunit E